MPRAASDETMVGSTTAMSSRLQFSSKMLLKTSKNSSLNRYLYKSYKDKSDRPKQPAIRQTEAAPPPGTKRHISEGLL